MRFALITALAACAVAAPAAAQTPPADIGPYLYAQHNADYLVMLAMGTRTKTSVGASATSITYLIYEGVGLRADALVEADCTNERRRSGPISLFIGEDTSQRGSPLGQAPAVEWSPWGPDDGPIRDFLCKDGTHDPSAVAPGAGRHIDAWLADRD